MPLNANLSIASKNWVISRHGWRRLVPRVTPAHVTSATGIDRFYIFRWLWLRVDVDFQDWTNP